MLRVSGDKYRSGKVQISDVVSIREKSALIISVSYHKSGGDWKRGTETSIASSFLGRSLKRLLSANLFCYLRKILIANVL